MLLVLAVLGCVHQVSWEVQPRPSYTLPSLEVSVIAEDRACKRVADDLVDQLGTRPGVRVKPGASVQLILHECQEGSNLIVEVEDLASVGFPPSPEVVRRYLRRAWSTGELVVHGPGAPVTLLGSAERTDRGSWERSDGDPIPALVALQTSLRRDLARDLADQVAPLPETLRRQVYRDPQPGTSRQLHNEAVQAEREGDLQRAARLAEQAYAANPTRAEMLYLEDLKQHAEAVGYALLVEPSRQQ